MKKLIFVFLFLTSSLFARSNQTGGNIVRWETCTSSRAPVGAPRHVTLSGAGEYRQQKSKKVILILSINDKSKKTSYNTATLK